ncbi:conserved hypothetical protein [Paecilomyces variotii No. 5]|uniref:Uncharacterized protein n=1 Tax=Byssochlamys spectabilis (strain No. 5 / NBRC 109023) TaxID=1356009 RepID=V5G0L6_BYSSN|nr:conserved hypothetical protein [Paecilomyces variotii No. 5]
MPRRSSRVVPQSAAAAAPTPKRRPSAPLDTTAAVSSSKRQKTGSPAAGERSIRSTAKTSKYFQNSVSKRPGTAAESQSDPGSDSAPEESGSAYDVESASSEQDSETPAEDDTPKKRRNQGGRRKSAKEKAPEAHTHEQEQNEIITATKGKELWREGVRTGLGPGKQVFIKKPKARDPGNTPYQDQTIHPNTMLFLQDLKENNERQWLKAHDADYRTSKGDWDSFVDSLTEKIIEKDETIPELPAKDLVFRIHRDIRFSNDPTPYKVSHREERTLRSLLCPSAAWVLFCRYVVYNGVHSTHEVGPLTPNLFLTRAMVKRPAWTRQYGLPLAFRFSIVPHTCRLGREPFPLLRDVPAELTIYVLLLPGSGLWMPDASKLALLREDIDRNPQRIKAVLRDVDIRREFFNGIPDDDGKAVKAFASQNRENALKTKPKGYDQEHENIELLRLRNFTMGKPLPDAELLSADAQDKIAELVGIMVPFVTYLNSIVMPDPVDNESADSTGSEVTTEDID